MAKSKIEWTDKVWNPVTGCTKISPGCQNCYAERMSKRLAGRCGYLKDDPFKVTLHPDRLEEPLRWNKPSKIFVCSMGDLFHEDVPDEFIFEVFNTMANAQWIKGHKFLVLTKRPERMKQIIEAIREDIEQQRIPEKLPDGSTRRQLTFTFPLQNIWLGVTAENQEQADKRIPILIDTPAAKRFVSIEPMLEPVDLTRLGKDKPSYIDALGGELRSNGSISIDPSLPEKFKGLDWVIVGGETGPGARPMHPDWARAIRDQCQTAGVPFMFKQWGECMVCPPCPLCKGLGFRRVAKKKAGRLLDGREWDEFPK